MIHKPRLVQELSVSKYPELKGLPNLLIFILLC